MAWFRTSKVDGQEVAIDLLLQCLDSAAEYSRVLRPLIFSPKQDEGDFRREVFQLMFFATFCGLLSGLPNQSARDATIPAFLFYRDILLGARRHADAEKRVNERMYLANRNLARDNLALRRHMFQDIGRDQMNAQYSSYMDAFQSGGGDSTESFKRVATVFLDGTSKTPADPIVALNVFTAIGTYASVISDQVASYQWA